MGEDDRAKSEFNMAVSYLNRLNALLYIVDEAAITLDVHKWYHTLMALVRELSTEMKKDELKEINEEIKAINPLISKNHKTNLQQGTNDISNDLYTALHNLEIKLRILLKDAGLQNKMMDDAMSALG